MTMRLIVLLLSLQAASAVLFFSTGDPDFNTAPPAGELEGSGWQYQGQWGAFLGTVIAREYFLTAQHVGGSVGDRFLWREDAYEVLAMFDDPNSDLRICRIAGGFAEHAELYASADESGKSVVVFGRGTRRGLEVRLAGSRGAGLKGWQWGASDARLRWGENRVDSVLPPGEFPGSDETIGPALRSSFLVMNFDSSSGLNESHLSVGDSGGGVFIRDGTVWKLAGINYAVNGPYNTSNLGAGFQAAIFDETGLWTGGENNWKRSRSGVAARPGAFYSTRVSSNLAWINRIIDQPDLSETPVLQSANDVSEVFANETEAVVDITRRRVELSLPAGPRFYRLRAATALTISHATIESDKLILRYE